MDTNEFLQEQLANARARVHELAIELSAAQLVAAERDELLDAMPACPVCGLNNCFVYALKWIREMRAADGEEPPRADLPLAIGVRVRENAPVARHIERG